MGVNRLTGWAMAVAGAMSLAAVPALAAGPVEQQKRFGTEARAAGPGFSGFSAQRGQAFFTATHGGDWSCASCHTGNPLGGGKHAKTGKPIAPLAPAGNAQRFTDAATVDKWFRRNCNDVLGRACTAQEKGDVLEYLMSLK
jgi:mono/diheme cytochrome c family protein